MTVWSDLGPPALRSLARALSAGRLGVRPSASALRKYVPSGMAESVQHELLRLADEGWAPAQIARLLRTVADERTAAQEITDRLSLVWSGPETQESGSRDTAVVAQELFRSAERSVLVASYALDRGDKARAIFATLAERMDELPDLSVRLFVNVHRPWGDETPDSILLREFSDAFRKDIWPGTRLPEVFYDPRALATGGGTRACLHAKCIVVDGRKAFITSANFTEAAHSRNIEAGVLVNSASVARNLTSQFESLVDSEVLRRLPL